MGDDAVRAAVVAAVSLLMLVRLFAAVLTVPVVVAGPDPVRGLAAVGVSALLAGVVLALRERLADAPAGLAGLVAAELAADAGVLALDGVGQPFLCQSIGTAGLLAALWGAAGAALGATLGLAASAVLVATDGDAPIAVVAGLPTPYAVTAVLFAVVRHVQREQVELRTALRRATELATRAEERARLARELHDSVAKTLVGIGLSARGLRAGPPGAAAELADVIAAAADQALADARRTIGGLRTGPDAGPDLAAAVAAAVRAWAAAGPERAGVDLRPAPEPPPAVRAELMAVLAEALDNVRRHAAAGTVTVTLGPEGAGLRLVVADDGGGFDPARPRPGRYGLVGMHERLAAAGGRLTVVSRPGGGTVVSAVAGVTRDTSPGPDPGIAG